MHVSAIRNSTAAAAAAFALAACGGHALVPSQSGAPGYDAVSPFAANPCYTKAVQPTWLFKGACKIVKLPAKGITIKLAVYKGVTVTVKLPKNNSKGNPTFAVVDAKGGKTKDIAPYKRKPLPALPKSSGTPVIYVEAVNSFAGLQFTGGDLVLSATGKLPSTKCLMSLLQSSGKWLAIPIAATTKGSTVTETIPAGSVKIFFPNGLPKGPLFFAASCK